MTTDQQLPRTSLKHPCAACPFTTRSLPGWLGPFSSPEELHQRVMSEEPFSCHKTIDYDDQPVEETELCVGSLLYMARCAKSPRFSWLRKQIERALGRNSLGGILSIREFLERHRR